MRADKFSVTMLLGALLWGCGSPEIPTPRHPIVPVPISGLTARQVGDAVVLDFALPTTSTDQQPLGEMPSVEIYRGTAQPAAPAKSRAKNRSTARLVDSIPSDALANYQRNGRVEFSDKLEPSNLANGAGTDLVYTVRTSASRGKESADSNPAALRVYPPPETARDLRVTLTEKALVLDWSASQPSKTNAGAAPEFHIYRAEVNPADAAAAVSNPSEAKLVAPAGLVAQTMGTQYRDARVQYGHTYFYSVRAAVQFGTETVESADSLPAVLTAKDIFPPATPQGLEGVAVPAQNGGPATIELTWLINTEADLAGYNVYRSEQEDLPARKLNTEVLSAPTFHDMSVVPGTYFYRVGALDTSGNESALSPAVEVQVPGP